jgi:hypothetical protein
VPLARPVFQLRRLTTVPQDARVHHYDELDERTQTAVAVAVESGGAFSPEPSARVAPGDVVVYTDYFEVSS